MNILLQSWTWFPSGGDFTYVNSMENLYKKKGHNVIAFSSKDSKNIYSEYSDFFIEKFDTKSRNPFELFKNIKSAGEKLEQLILSNNIDVAHLNNLNHYLTNEILRILKKHNIPVIITLHDFKFICSLTSLFRKENICEECFGGKFYKCTVNKCKGGKLIPSIQSSIQNYYYNLKKIYNNINYFICPSEFIRNVFIRNGFDKNKLITINHFYDKSIIDDVNRFSHEPVSKKQYISYLGRIIIGKGIRTLVEAVAGLSEVNLVVIGYGTMLEELKEFCEVNKLKNIEFTGNKERVEALNIVKHSKFLVVPSTAYEVYPYTVIEGMLLGKPVIGSDFAAFPEVIKNNENGFLFKPGSVHELKEIIRNLYDDDDTINELGSNALSNGAKFTDQDSYYEKVENVFRKLQLM